MANYLFSLIVEGIDPQSDLQVDQVAALDDVLVVSDLDGAIQVHLEVEAADSASAIQSAIAGVESAARSAKVRGVDLDLVAAADIAMRVGVSRQAVANWAGGKRGGEPFPVAIGRVAGGTRIWAWSQVLPWLSANGHAGHLETAPDWAAIVEMNGLLHRPGHLERAAPCSGDGPATGKLTA